MPATDGAKAELYTRYPLSSVLIYQGATILHFLLGALGIAVGYRSSWAGTLFGVIYLLFSCVEMYAVMPLRVCPNCVYYRLSGSRCVSGLNLVSSMVAGEGKAADFPKRAAGVLCPNNLYMASLIVPIVAVIPALITNGSPLLVTLSVTLVVLLLFRFFVIFPRIACLHCRAKFLCPQAAAMGVREE